MEHRRADPGKTQSRTSDSTYFEDHTLRSPHWSRSLDEPDLSIAPRHSHAQVARELDFATGKDMPKSKFRKNHRNDGRGVAGVSLNEDTPCWKWKYILYVPIVLVPLCVKLILRLATLRAVAASEQSDQARSFAHKLDAIKSGSHAINAAVPAHEGPFEGQLNLLFIMSDQHRFDTIGATFETENPEVLSSAALLRETPSAYWTLLRFVLS